MTTDADRERRRARREALRRDHPDHGGSDDAFIATLAAHASGPVTPAGPGAAPVIRRTRGTRLRRRLYTWRRARRADRYFTV